MKKRMTIEEFITKARVVHGDKYDYSQVEYVNSKTKVKIICPIHGEFEQAPEKHWAGRGCSLCGKEKWKETNIKKYGNPYPLQNQVSKERCKETCLERYGTDNPSKSEDVKEQTKRTNLERYGVEWTCLNDEVTARRQEINKRKYGGISPFCSEDVQQKAHDTIMDTYGVTNAFLIPEAREKYEKTCMELFGTPFAIQSPKIREKIQETCLKRWGAKTPFESRIILEQAHQQMRKMYHVENIMKLQEFRNKVTDTKRNHGTFTSSSGEEMLYEILVDLFGEDDVKRQYQSELYPFACDFYIPSRNMYIELNGHWSHTDHWYDISSREDAEIVDLWCERDTLYYKNSLEVWTERDVLKRQTARKHHLNYVVFWHNTLEDVELWLALNCPDGHDYDMEYSWLMNEGEYAI